MMLCVDEEERSEEVGGAIICTCAALVAVIALACFERRSLALLWVRGCSCLLQSIQPISVQQAATSKTGQGRAGAAQEQATSRTPRTEPELQRGNLQEYL